ncbi:hypothetical protein ABEB36_000875 [Hypothenemus hampei]|uniref:Secretory calcium-binding phosphoprotein 5 n=1 Tax=Hypothenemus hampei TaxID=57062 RepID=A0ABD1FCR5_HYPHA
MKLIAFSIFYMALHWSNGSEIVPASTTLIRQATSISHPTQPVVFTYNSPVAYSLSPSVYTHQSIFQYPFLLPQLQYPGFISQTPIAAQFPPFQTGVLPQVPATGPENPNNPDAGVSPVPQAPPAPQPTTPQLPSQQSPTSSGGTTFDDDSVSVEAA